MRPRASCREVALFPARIGSTVSDTRMPWSPGTAFLSRRPLTNAVPTDCFARSHRHLFDVSANVPTTTTACGGWPRRDGRVALVSFARKAARSRLGGSDRGTCAGTAAPLAMTDDELTQLTMLVTRAPFRRAPRMPPLPSHLHRRRRRRRRRLRRRRRRQVPPSSPPPPSPLLPSPPPSPPSSPQPHAVAAFCFSQSAATLAPPMGAAWAILTCDELVVLRGACSRRRRSVSDQR